MLYEVRTYDIKPRSLPEVEKRFAEAYEHRKKYSPLAAFWHTEMGPVNQIIHVWGYADLNERARIRAEAGKDPNWPPKTGEFILNMRSEIMMQFPFSPELQPAKLGPIYEMRTYTLKPGALPRVQKGWAAALPKRLEYSPLAAVWYSDLGELNNFVHIWAYESLDQRLEMRARLREDKVWPPALQVPPEPGENTDNIFRQENKILLPSDFSPMQ